MKLTTTKNMINKRKTVMQLIGPMAHKGRSINSRTVLLSKLTVAVEEQNYVKFYSHYCTSLTVVSFMTSRCDVIIIKI